MTKREKLYGRAADAMRPDEVARLVRHIAAFWVATSDGTPDNDEEKQR
jgi:hypothetical protein